MIRIRFPRVAVLTGLLVATGCSSMTATDKGALGGGAIGAGTGAIVGHALGSTAAGAVIGGAVGALSGGLIGNQVEKNEQKREAAAEQARNAMGINDVIQMAQAHVNDSVIIGQIRSSGTVFHLTGQDVLTLKQNGVSDPVIQEMMATASRVPQQVYSAAPVYPPVYRETVYVVEPSPPPVAVGVGFYGGGGRRCWR
jgi:hypothetical protein